VDPTLRAIIILALTKVLQTIAVVVVVILAEEGLRTEEEEGAVVDEEAAIGDVVVEVDSVVEVVMMMVRDVDILLVDVRIALDLEDVEVSVEALGDHVHDPRDEIIVHLHPDDAQGQNLHIEVIDVDHLREIGMVTIQVSSHPEQALLLLLLIVIATMDEDARIQGPPHVQDHLPGDINVQDQIHGHLWKWIGGPLRR
jgi:hypothetical protein